MRKVRVNSKINFAEKNAKRPMVRKKEEPGRKEKTAKGGNEKGIAALKHAANRNLTDLWQKDKEKQDLGRET